ncbi:MAG: YdeI/OmpD-associated family protein [Gemmatimonadaceae bacterium]
MDRPKTLNVVTREQWRRWLSAHGDATRDVWIRFYKRHTGRPRLAYDDAVEEAICFGWIDSIVRRIDDASYAQKFTPRRDGSKWSDLNRERLRRMIAEGRMTPTGLAKAAAVIKRQSNSARRDADEVPDDLRSALVAHGKAWETFQSFTPSRRRAYVRLITDAKKEETRQRRMKEVIALLVQGTGEPQALPVFLSRALKTNRKAWENFSRLAPSHRRHYVGWIMMAKKPETRARRLREAIALLEQNKKLGLK